MPQMRPPQCHMVEYNARWAVRSLANTDCGRLGDIYPSFLPSSNASAVSSTRPAVLSTPNILVGRFSA
jgi:hypothetical protein